MENVLLDIDRERFREWLSLHCQSEKEVWVNVVRKRPEEGIFTYLDAVEEALCFGWIDSVQKRADGVLLQRFSPRSKNSPWTELNKERVRRLERLGLMREEGRKVLPKMGERSFKPDPDIIARLKKARVYKTFLAFPKLYQRVRLYNVAFYKNWNKQAYEKALSHLIEQTKKGKMYGEWNDYGRLS